MAVQQFDTNKRLLALLKNEMRAEQQMNAIAKQSSKYHKNVATLKDAIQKQQSESEKILEILKQRREDLEARHTVNELVQEQVVKAKEHLEKMQQQLETAKLEYNQIRGCVRTLCDATNTLVSKKELPTRLKGVSVSRSGDQWLPFDVAANDLKGLSTIWNRLQLPSENVAKWRQLMSATSTGSHSDNEIAHMSASLIEIDLTSPLSHE